MPSFALTSRMSSGIGADQVVHFLLATLGLGAGQVDLVEDRDDLEPGVHREEEIRQRLRLDALRRVDDEDRALARGERARHLVREVDVPRRVDEVELVVSPSCAVYVMRTALSLIVIPRSRSRSSVSRTCAFISRFWSMPVASIRRSARVDFPWSMCATMQKLRM